MPVEIATQRLPEHHASCRRASRSSSSAQDDELRVLPTLVYGDPPRARVDAGRLVPLGGAIPLRDEAEERALTRRLQQELELAPGHRVALRGEQALALAERIRALRRGAALRGRGLERFRREPAAGGALRRAPGRLRAALHRVRRRRPRAPRRRRSAVLRAWQTGESLVALEGGGFARAAARLARAARRARRRPARGAPSRGEALPRALLPDLARLCEALDTPVPAGRRRAAPRWPTSFERRARGRAARRSRGRAARLPAARRRLAVRAARRRARRAARRRHGPRQDARRRCARCAAARWWSRRPSVLPNWEARDRGASGPGCASRLYHGPRRALDPRGRRHAHQLRDPAPRRGARSRAVGWDTRRARRGAGDQEPRQPGGARGATRCAAASASR